MTGLIHRTIGASARRGWLKHGVSTLSSWPQWSIGAVWSLPTKPRSYSSMATGKSPALLLERIVQHENAVALIDQPDTLTSPGGNKSSSSSTSTSTSSTTFNWTYAQLLVAAERFSQQILDAYPALGMKNKSTNEQPRIAFLGSRGAPYVIIQWAIWLLGGIAVPLHPNNPLQELEYILQDAEVALIIASDTLVHNDPAIAQLVARTKHPQQQHQCHVLMFEDPSTAPLPSEDQRQASDLHQQIDQWAFHVRQHQWASHIVYTSGTTGRPKGVVTTHANATAQITDIVSAWEMTANDHLLHFLPLHHVHGIVNNLLCVHYAGGSLEFLSSAKADLIWHKLASNNNNNNNNYGQNKPVTMLMAVPTVYMNLLEEMERMKASSDASTRQRAHEAVQAARALRVTISGSMACPISIYERWQQLTDHVLLERYGMTELGMALTNPLHGTRHPGYVGRPFPSVSVRLVDPETDQELELVQGNEGELRVKGATVFREYWRKPEATAKEFDPDGWFKTGDIAEFNESKQSFRIRGRASADIIKSSGYKISALDIERVLLTHPTVRECAVFGLADDKYGQIVSAVVRLDTRALHDQNKKRLVTSLRQHVGDQLAKYRVPRKYFIVDTIPKNAMGKVNKKQLATLFANQPAS